jgi:hypothetical protein
MIRKWTIALGPHAEQCAFRHRRQTQMKARRRLRTLHPIYSVVAIVMLLALQVFFDVIPPGVVLVFLSIGLGLWCVQAITLWTDARHRAKAARRGFEVQPLKRCDVTTDADDHAAK